MEPCRDHIYTVRVDLTHLFFMVVWQIINIIGERLKFEEVHSYVVNRLTNSHKIKKKKEKKKRLTSSSFSPIDLLVKVIDKFSMSRTIYQDRDEITKVYFWEVIGKCKDVYLLPNFLGYHVLCWHIS